MAPVDVVANHLELELKHRNERLQEMIKDTEISLAESEAANEELQAHELSGARYVHSAFRRCFAVGQLAGFERKAKTYY